MLVNRLSVVILFIFMWSANCAYLKPHILNWIKPTKLPYRSAQLSEEQIQEIEGVFLEMSLDPQKYDIFLSDNRSFCCMTGPGSLYLENDFFTLHDKQGRRACIGHEAAHFLQENKIVPILLSTGFIYFGLHATIGTFLSLLPHEDNLLSKQDDRDDIKAILVAFLCLPLHLSFMGAYQRSREKDADLVSVRKLRCAAGALSDFESWRNGTFEKTHFSLSRKRRKTFFEYVDSFLNRFIKIKTHPTDKERIAYITEEEKILQMLDELIPDLMV